MEVYEVHFSLGCKTPHIPLFNHDEATRSLITGRIDRLETSEKVLKVERLIFVLKYIGGKPPAMQVNR